MTEHVKLRILFNILLFIFIVTIPLIGVNPDTFIYIYGIVAVLMTIICFIALGIPSTGYFKLALTTGIIGLTIESIVVLALKYGLSYWSDFLFFLSIAEIIILASAPLAGLRAPEAPYTQTKAFRTIIIILSLVLFFWVGIMLQLGLTVLAIHNYAVTHHIIIH